MAMIECGFKDHFSHAAVEYSKYRPQYPRELFVYLQKLYPEAKVVWDVATGNGQAACQLAEYFEKIFATALRVRLFLMSFNE